MKVKQRTDLRKVFKYSKVIEKFHNDSDQIIEIGGISLAPNADCEIGANLPEDDLIIINEDRYNISDKEIFKLISEEDLASKITQRSGRLIDDGGFSAIFEFLEYHYKYTKDKKALLQFVKEHILTLNWDQNTKNNKFGTYDELIKWIENKSKRRKKIFFIILLISMMVLMIVLAIIENELKLVISALLGSSLVLLGKLVEKYV